jgi:hypothetical protein
VLSLLEPTAKSHGKRFTFGGRVAIDGVDGGAVLRGYYPSLEIARELLASDPNLAPAIRHFIDHGVRAGRRFRPLLAQATGLDLRSALLEPDEEDIEPAEQLGRATPSLERFRSVAVDNQGPEEWLLVRDPTIREVVFGRGGLQRDLSMFLQQDVNVEDADYQRILPAVLRVYARAREINVPKLTVSDWSVVTEHLPRTRENVALMRRLVRAFRADPVKIALQGQALYDRPLPTAQSFRLGSPLGDVSRYTHDIKGWMKALRQGREDAFRVNDETIHRALAFSNQDLDTVFLNLTTDPQRKLDLLHVCARGLELGYARNEDSIWDNHIEELPVTQESVDLTRYIGRLREWDEGSVILGGRPLASHRSTRAFPNPRPEEPLGPALGDIEILESELEDVIDKGDPRGLAFSDECLNRIVNGNCDALMNPSHSKGHYRKREWHLAVLQLLVRATRNGVFVPELADEMTKLFQVTLSPKDRTDPEIMEGLARLIRAGKTNPFRVLVTPELRLEEYEPFIAARDRLERRLSGVAAPVESRSRIVRGPIGDQTFPKPPKRAELPPTLELDDGSIRGLIETYNANYDQFFVLDEWLAHFRSPRVYLFAARMLELAQQRQIYGCFGRELEQMLQGPIPSRYVTEESIPWILRFSTAIVAQQQVHFDPSGITVRATKTDPPIALTQHPAYAKAVIPSRLEVEARLERMWNALEPEQQSDAERSAAVSAVIGDAKPGIDLMPILSELIDRAASGHIARAPASEEVMASLATWNHAAAIALLGGLLTEAPIDRIAALLEEKGHPVSVVQTWSRVAIELRSVPKEQMRLALETPPPASSPDFVLLPLRVALARLDLEHTQTELLRILRHDHFQAAGCAAALMARALGEPPGSPARQRLVDYLSRCVREGLITPEEMRAAADALPRLNPKKPLDWPLAPELIQPLFDLIDGPKAERAGRLGPIFAKLTNFADPMVAARAVLRHAHAIDLEQVEPLDSPIDRASSEPAGLAALAVETLERASIEDGCTDDLNWIELVLQAGVPPDFTEDALVGLAEAVAQSRLPVTLLAFARDNVALQMVRAASKRVRSARARTILDNRSPSVAVIMRAAAPSAEEPIAPASVTAGPTAPLEDPSFDRARVLQGPRAPERPERD